MRHRLLLGSALILLLVVGGALYVGRASAPSGPIERVADLAELPAALAVDVQTGRLFAANSSANSVSVFDTSGQLLVTTGVSYQPRALAIDEAHGRVYVASNGSAATSFAGTVDVLDAATGARLSTITLPGAPAPLALAVDAGTHRLFVANSDGSVDIFNTASLRFVRSVAVGTQVTQSVHAAVDETDGVVLVSNDNIGSTSPPSRSLSLLGLLDARSGRLLARLGIGPYPREIIVDAGRGRAYVPVMGSRRGEAIQVVDVRHGRLLGPALPLGTGAAPAAGGLPSLVPFGTPAFALDARIGRLYAAEGSSVESLSARGIAGAASLAFSGPGNGVGPEAEAMLVNGRADRLYITMISIATSVGRTDLIRRITTALAVVDTRTLRTLRTIQLGQEVTLHTLPFGVTGVPVAYSAVGHPLMGGIQTLAAGDRGGHVYVAVPAAPAAAPDPAAWMPGWLRHAVSFLPLFRARTQTVSAHLYVIDASR